MDSFVLMPYNLDEQIITATLKIREAKQELWHLKAVEYLIFIHRTGHTDNLQFLDMEYADLIQRGWLTVTDGKAILTSSGLDKIKGWLEE